MPWIGRNRMTPYCATEECRMSNQEFRDSSFAILNSPAEPGPHHPRRLAVAAGVPVPFAGGGVGETVEEDALAGRQVAQRRGEGQEVDPRPPAESAEAPLGIGEVGVAELGREGLALPGIGIDLDRRRQADEPEA